jgi:small subunit ribosomal protein S8
MMTDPIADMLTRMRNAHRIGRKSVSMPASKVKVGIAQVLKDEGYVDDYRVEPGTPSSTLQIVLRYGPNGERVIRRIERVSKPGRRVYGAAQDLTKVVRGMGIQVLSTNQGIVSDRKAREMNVGGEVLCKVF